MLKKISLLSNKDSGLFDGLVVGFGFFPIAMAFGVIAKGFGLSIIETAMCSLIVFAGASQFAALGVLMGGGTYFEAVLITFLMNLRHFLMGVSLMVIHKDKFTAFKPFLGFMLTDESYTFLSLTQKKMSSGFALLFQLMTYISWNLGTVSGFLVGASLPAKASQSLEIALYAMFVSLASFSVKSDRNNLKIILFSGSVHTILNTLNLLNPSWNLIISMVAGAMFGTVISKPLEVLHEN